MRLKLRTITESFGVGLLSGAAAHYIAAILVAFGERLAHFLGHVLAAITLHLIQ
jgi:hypothetical protein